MHCVFTYTVLLCNKRELVKLMFWDNQLMIFCLVIVNKRIQVFLFVILEISGPESVHTDCLIRECFVFVCFVRMFD